MDEMQSAARIEINGIVQGVGFRPFVYQLALAHQLKGEVSNTADGVSVIVEGPARQIDAFFSDLSIKQPPLARIVEIRRQPLPFNGYAGFQIVPSRSGAGRSTLISPDVSVCDDCLREMFDPADRRYHYPFINCTNCGPRYTIIADIPYDRPKTSMQRFVMCPRCQAEYDDPLNRRFHAQPNACPVCGPQVTLLDNTGQRIEAPDPIARAAEWLKEGKILAIKGLGGFHLAADATQPGAVVRLRQRKHREEKPLALMSPDLEQIAGYAHIGAEDRRLLTSIQRPIVLLRKKYPNPICAAVSPGNLYFGIMLPYTPLHYLLLSFGFTALVMTSGNLSEEPIAIENDEALKRLGGIADVFLIHDRDIYLRSDDSIVRHLAGATRFIRRSRGYVPVPVFFKDEVPQILACGAELKNTVCLTKGRNAFVSQHIGDLENLASEDFFRQTIDHLKQILDIDPRIVVCDLHPDYLSTRYARLQAADRLMAVQHHHAHIAACMAENQIDGPVIGLALDGTGYGSDGAVWGGEVLLAGLRDFTRFAHLSYVPMPGSAAAIKEPWRMAVSHLHAAFGDGLYDLPLPAIQALDRNQVSVIVQMLTKRINAPLTSSLGRLFDALAAIIGLRRQVAFEGQAAMELEMIAAPRAKGRYPVEFEGQAPVRILTEPIIRGVVADLQKGLGPDRISAKFHRTLIELFSALCRQIRDAEGLRRVALSGGVFQNAILLQGLTKSLAAQGFDV
jgi:hydrogenase maturation protein HypF